jgi:DNA-binding beta-propeller fold protein YncE
MAVDGSIYVLKQDGTIVKFTRGQPDSFTISGLTTLPSDPKKIYTTVDLDNVYVLDTKNFQVLSFSKTGTFVSSYQADILKDAKNIVVSEDDKKIYFLAQDTIWSIPLE